MQMGFLDSIIGGATGAVRGGGYNLSGSGAGTFAGSKISAAAPVAAGGNTPRTYLSGGKGSTKMQLPNTVNCFLHNEDLDLNAAAGAVAASLAGGQLGCLLSGTDSIYANKPFRYLGYQYGDEESTLADADAYIGIGNKRRIWIGLEDVNEHGWSAGFFPSPLLVANQELIDLIGKSTGGGAEQHSCVHFVDQPDRGTPWAIGSPYGAPTCIKVEQPTATMVANTISGFTDICGRTTAYSGSQRAISNTASITGVLYAITPINTVGYSGIAIRNPTQDKQLVLLGNAGKVSGGVGATNSQTVRYDFTQIFGGGLAFRADEPLLLGGFGVGTTAQSAVLEMALFGVDVDG